MLIDVQDDDEVVGHLLKIHGVNPEPISDSDLILRVNVDCKHLLLAF
jgi:hypothetical protein